MSDITRRSLLTLSFPISAIAQVQSFIREAKPTCPLCHLEVEANHPEYMPVIGNVDPSLISIAALQNLRLMFCNNCSNVFVAKI